ncbi:zwei Ig domain protein zig-8-like isoform X3 [Bombus pyrosoma]|uniref:zwei Ig domain protein zig-8-like isoform X3 n=1 Tax=Bombus pyrosoma TaxID=396416 RepID=UPI001CB97105|nr:zwei Ig domain protein zig-8-like isoform X3 [Bombus pyrosoma]
MINMKFFRVFLALLGGTHVLCAQPSASPTVKSTGGSSLASVVAGSKPLNKPDFDDIAPRNVTAIVGQTAELNCFVKHPGDRVVSWIRKRDLHILTSSIYAYTGDERFSVKHPEASDEWTLKIDYVQQRDAGVYECQVNTEPKLNLAFVLRVEESAPVPATTTPNAIHRTFNSAAQAKILGPEEVYVKKGSTISLTCTVNVQSTPPSSVSWHHGGAVVDFDSPRRTSCGDATRRKLRRHADHFISDLYPGDIESAKVSSIVVNRATSKPHGLIELVSCTETNMYHRDQESLKR